MARALVVVAAAGFELSAPLPFGGSAVVRPDACARHAFSTELPLAAEGPVSRVLGRDDGAYRAVWDGAGFALGNPRQHLGAWFDRRGVVIRSGQASLALGLSGYGYGRSLRAAGTVVPIAQANRVVYGRGALIEWYTNGPLGLEQGFSLNARPEGDHGGPLTLSLALSGNVYGVLSPDARAVIFTRSGVSLAYRGLIASDAYGRLLPAEIELRPGELLLRIDERRARYPLRIDPFIQQAKLTASDGIVGDQLGFAVAVSGDTVVAGAPGAEAAYVFVKPAGGWASETEAAKLTVSGGPVSDGFGTAVAVSGDTVVIGAPYTTVKGEPDQGTAYVFVKPAGGWASETEQARLTASDGAPLDELGYAVAASGDTVVAGAPAPNNANAQGAAYVFVKPAGGWRSETEAAKLTALDRVGYAVAVSDDTAVAGAPYAWINGQPIQGAAYVFVKPAGGWTSETEAAKLTASDGAAYDELGYAVAVSGDTVVAGAPAPNDLHQGAAYVFVKPGGGWASETEAAKLIASDGTAVDNLGLSVAASGDTVVAGAPGAAVKRHALQGAAYVFVKPGGFWASETEQAKLTAADGTGGDELGSSVAVSGETVVAGASGPIVGQHPQGALYAFGPPTTTITVVCSPGSVGVGQATTCTVTVTDSRPSPTTPSGNVSFGSDTSGGAFSNSGLCTLSPTATPGQASCQVSYTPGQVGTGTHRITASYSGDDTHPTTSGSTTVSVPNPMISVDASNETPGRPRVSLISVTGSGFTPGGTAEVSTLGRKETVNVNGDGTISLDFATRRRLPCTMEVGAVATDNATGLEAQASTEVVCP